VGGAGSDQTALINKPSSACKFVESSALTRSNLPNDEFEPVSQVFEPVSDSGPRRNNGKRNRAPRDGRPIWPKASTIQRGETEFPGRPSTSL
jgi:hypothetical protein